MSRNSQEEKQNLSHRHRDAGKCILHLSLLTGKGTWQNNLDSDTESYPIGLNAVTRQRNIVTEIITIPSIHCPVPQLHFNLFCI